MTDSHIYCWWPIGWKISIQGKSIAKGESYYKDGNIFPYPNNSASNYKRWHEVPRSLFWQDVWGRKRAEDSFIVDMVELILSSNFGQLRILLSSVSWSAKADRVHEHHLIYTDSISRTELHMNSVWTVWIFTSLFSKIRYLTCSWH